MTGQIIGIIDKTQGCVLIEMFEEDFSSFDKERIYVSAFIKLPIMGQIKIQAKRFLQFLQEVIKPDKMGAFFFS